MSGDDIGTVIGKEATRWGIKLWIRLSDFRVTSRVCPAAGQIGIVVTDDCGVFEGAEKIGVYVVAT